MSFKVSVYLLLSLLPWHLRRPLMCRLFGYRISTTARISRFALIVPEYLEMGAGARIGALTVAIHLHTLEMGSFATIGRQNWITGHPKDSARHFVHRTDRNPALRLGQHSAITKSHIIDCTDSITIGCFTTVAGYGSQFITHGIDYLANRQDCRPIEIGSYCLIGSRVIVVGGGTLPDRSVLAAGAVLQGKSVEQWKVYAGIPARAVKDVAKDALYFSRLKGFVP